MFHLLSFLFSRFSIEVIMPVFKSGESVPDWCELNFFDIIELQPGDTHVFERVAEMEKVMIGSGKCRLSANGEVVDGEAKTRLELPTPDGQFEVLDVFVPSTVIRLGGKWGDDLGGFGVFTAALNDHRTNGGDPITYEKDTAFDRHFHDCDEYWIFFEGHCEVVSEDKHYRVGPGDCVATGMGWHHDLPKVKEPIKAVYFETTMQREMRRGHLWEHKHGPARPVPERV